MYHFFGDYQDVKGLLVNQSNRHRVDYMVNGLISFKSNIQFRGIWSSTIPKHLEEDKCTIYGGNGTISFSFYEEELKLDTEIQHKVLKFKNPENIQQPLIQQTVNKHLQKHKMVLSHLFKISIKV